MMRRRLFASAAPLALVLLAADAHATVTLPNGQVVPRDSANGEVQLYTMFANRSEPVNWQTDSNTTPDTFSPLCSFTAEFVLKQSGSSIGVGWYNVIPGAMSAPAAGDIYNIVPAGSPVGTKIIGTDILKDARYKGGLIGFALQRSPPFFSEAKWNPVCTSCTPNAPWILSVTYQSKVIPNAYYLAFEDGNVTGSSFGNDGDYNDYVFLFSGIQCAGAGTACDTGKKGLCARGANTCVDGKLVCKDAILPGAKTCNGLDNDCNGVIDNGPCPTGTICTRGACLPQCGVGEFKCGGGLTCDNGLCVEPACVGKACPDGQTCVAGNCVAACTGVVCPKGQLCTGGVCIDLCGSLMCGTDEVCEDGLCKTKCDCAGCPTGKACDTTSKKCVEPACAGKTCAAGQLCSAGNCVDACTGVTCPKGQACTAGQCIAVSTGGDAGPDATTVQDSGSPIFEGGFGNDDTGVTDDASAADASSDTGDNFADNDEKLDPGCGCRTTGSTSSGGLGVLGLALAVGARRRRTMKPRSRVTMPRG